MVSSPPPMFFSPKPFPKKTIVFFMDRGQLKNGTQFAITVGLNMLFVLLVKLCSFKKQLSFEKIFLRLIIPEKALLT
jgi:hypothetical protein